jgi:uncharacterized membrane protein
MLRQRKEIKLFLLLFLFKVILWRIVSFLSMLVTIHIITGDTGLAGKVTLIVQVIQTIVHAFFEASWKEFASRDQLGK